MSTETLSPPSAADNDAREARGDGPVLPAAATAQPTRKCWPIALTCVLAGLAVLFAGYWQTFLSMIQIWQRSETFTHGFLIFPISGYLIWRRRQELAALAPCPEWIGLVVLAQLGLVWQLSKLAGVLVVEQLAVIAMIAALSLSLLGKRIVWEIAFPLGFLFFAVPIGEFLIPSLMNFTADFTVKLIELSGIPVYREGTFFSIPSGDWSVVEGCSGLRYLIASITCGCLYAYLNYRAFWRRLAFIALACLFPVFANGLRAYGIVMIAHLSDMRLALGIDHYLYGWVFFGLVIVLMFWIGSFWREANSSPENLPALSLPAASPPLPLGRLLRSTLLALACLLIWPVFAVRGLAQAELAPVALELPQAVGVWHRAQQDLTAWQPHYLFPDAVVQANYTDGGRQVKVYLFYYRTQAQGKELVNSQNVLIPQKHPVWRMPWEKPKEVRLAGQKFKVREGLLLSADQRLLVWRWNWVSSTFTVSDSLAKLLEAKDKLLGSPKDAAGVVVATESSEEDNALAKAKLQDFTSAFLPALQEVLLRAGEKRLR